MRVKRSNKRSLFTLFAGATLLAALFSFFGCNEPGNNGTETSSKPTPSATPTPAPAPPPPPPDIATLTAREPERYSVTTVVTVEPTGKSPKADLKPVHFVFAKMGTDRRISFSLPEPVGEVIYLEKAPLKYLIIPARNQYVELDPKELGFELGKMMSPSKAIERLKGRTQSETLGTETLNGRTVVKYRLKGSADTHTKLGTAAADSVLFVDQETGLPLRSEIETTSSSGAGARIVTNAERLELSPSPSLFEVPTAMKKVTSAELKQQVQGFVNVIRVLAGYLRQQATSPS